jgi:beta-glucanase (GH16 family)
VLPGWRLVAGDEFGDTAVDATRWKRYHNTYGDGNKELACLTPDNVVESGGSLRITARRQQVTCPNGSVRQYTSGFIGSREVGRYFPRYGRFEIRAKVPHAQGLWPAFWLRHRSGAGVAEVDILEYFHSQHPGKGYATLHLDGRKNLSKNSIAFESSKVAVSGWHTWAVEISPDPAGVRFEFSMDGTRFHSYVDTQHHWTSADPTATWDIALNLAVGGTWTGGPDDVLGYLRDLNRCSISGTPPNSCVTTGINRVDWTDPVDATYEIDYVRVFTR